MRAAVATLLGQLMAQPLHGPRVSLLLSRLLPPGLVSAIQVIFSHTLPLHRLFRPGQWPTSAPDPQQQQQQQEDLGSTAVAVDIEFGRERYMHYTPYPRSSKHKRGDFDGGVKALIVGRWVGIVEDLCGARRRALVRRRWRRWATPQRHRSGCGT